MIKKVWAVYFSGTGTTEKMCTYIGKLIAEQTGAEYESYDYTPLMARKKNFAFSDDDLVVLGTPVIAGRVPNLLLKYLDTFKGGSAYGIPIVLYGNRNFDDALVELRNIMEEDGFVTIAGGAFVGQHTFSDTLGAGRPDAADLKEAEKFTAEICALIDEKGDSLKVNHEPVFVEGNNPPGPYYKPKDKEGNHINILNVVPETTEECDNCGLCAKLCPLGSIDSNDCSVMTGKCMKCGACIRKCPKHAKYYSDRGLLFHKQDLEEMFGPVRGENRWFVNK